MAVESPCRPHDRERCRPCMRPLTEHSLMDFDGDDPAGTPGRDRLGLDRWKVLHRFETWNSQVPHSTVYDNRRP